MDIKVGSTQPIIRKYLRIILQNHCSPGTLNPFGLILRYSRTDLTQITHRSHPPLPILLILPYQSRIPPIPPVTLSSSRSRHHHTIRIYQLPYHLPILMIYPYTPGPLIYLILMNDSMRLLQNKQILTPR